MTAAMKKREKLDIIFEDIQECINDFYHQVTPYLSGVDINVRLKKSLVEDIKGIETDITALKKVMNINGTSSN